MAGDVGSFVPGDEAQIATHERAGEEGRNEI
jgi:hypothetical protein